jgi:hypothetical protein
LKLQAEKDDRTIAINLHGFDKQTPKMLNSLSVRLAVRIIITIDTTICFPDII